MGERTQAPSPERRRRVEAEHGRPTSRVLTAAVALGLAAWVWPRGVPQAFVGMVRSAVVEDPSGLQAAALEVARHALLVLGALAAGAVAASLVQSGVSIRARSNEHLGPEPRGVGLVRALLVTFAITVALGAPALTVLATGGSLVVHPPEELAALLGESLRGVVARLALALLVAGVLDRLLAGWARERALLVTESDARRAQRESEGDPELRAERRRRIGLDDVESAHFVVWGDEDEGIFIALAYDPESDSEPRSVATARGELARALRRLTDARNIPRFDEPGLARELASRPGAIPEASLEALAGLVARLEDATARSADRS